MGCFAKPTSFKNVPPSSPILNDCLYQQFVMLTRCDTELGALFLTERPTDPKGLVTYHVPTPAFTGKLPHPSAVHHFLLLFWKGEKKN